MMHLLAAAALMVQMQAPSSGLVWGQVRSQNTGAPLSYAVVEVPVTGRDDLRISTDQNGIYVLRGVPAGRRIVRATHIDHAPLEVEVVVPAGGQIALDFGLRLRPVELPVVLARGGSMLPPIRRDTIPTTTPEIGAAAVHVLDGSPGVAELGLAEVARQIPGYEPLDPTDVLYVRGGAADLKLVLIDGAPVYAPFHLAGLIPALDTDWLHSATMHLAGAPARYDGGLSYVMDIESRSGRTARPHARVAADMLAASARVEGPLVGGAGYLVGARTVHGFGAGPFFSDAFPYAYADVLARLDVDAGAGRVSATGFWNEESVRFGQATTGDGAASWGNRAGSLRYRTELLGGGAHFTAAASSFLTALPLGGARPLVTEARSDRVRLAADFERVAGPVRLGYGASVERATFTYEAEVRRPQADTLLLRARGTGDVGGVYVDGSVNVLPVLRLRAGLRADQFSLIDELRLAPRFTATLALGSRAALTVAGGRYHQYVRAPDEEIIFVGSVVRDSVTTPTLAVARASHLAVQLGQELTGDIRLGIEGYYKNFEGLPVSAGQAAEASGVDIWLRRAGDRLNGWFGYSLAWVWSSDEDRYSETRAFAGRHLVSAGVGGPIVGRGAFDVSVAYGAGLPYTAIPEPQGAAPSFAVRQPLDPTTSAAAISTPGTPGQQPDEPYLRIDAQLQHTWLGRVNGTRFEFTPYLRVINALNRRDAIFYHVDRTAQGTELRALATLPVLPVVGMEWRF